MANRNWVYENNGGTCVAIAGLDYCVVAADTRLSVGYSIYTRDYSKICELADKSVLASSGFQGDIKALQKNLSAKHLLSDQCNPGLSQWKKHCQGFAEKSFDTSFLIQNRRRFHGMVISFADSLPQKFGTNKMIDAMSIACHGNLLYQHQHNKQMSCPAMAQLLSNTLYYKRFFPYYAFNVLGGLDNEGKGCVFTYDAVGSYERVGYSAQGSGSTLIMPVLDNQLKSPSPLLLPARDAVTPLSESEAVDMVKDVFASATERDIYTGDKVEIVVINAAGIRREFMELRKD